MTISGLLSLCLCVFWPVAIWYFERLLDKSDEPLGVVSLIAFIAIIVTRQGATASKRTLKIPRASIACLLLYAATWPIAPKLLSAIIAVVTIGCLISSQGGKFKLGLGTWLLLLFSLPIVSSLNFYSGYPLRLVVGKIAAPLISMVGFPTIADGTALVWNNQMIQIDAPCSGIKMLWFALFVGAVLSSVLELSFLLSLTVLSSAVLAALLGNVLRITSLFFIEAKVLPIDPSHEQFIHQSVGAVSFAIAAGVTAAFAKILSKKDFQRSPDEKPSEHADLKQITEETAESVEVPDFAKTVGAKADAMQSQKGNPQIGTLFTKRTVAFLVSALIAGVTPLAFSRTVDNSASTGTFPGWPNQYNGASIEPVPPQKADLAFYREFPGRIQCFSQGARRVIIRWVAKPTRQLHPSSDCFRGVGYDVTWQPLITDREGNRWSSFSARKENHELVVRERIYDGNGQNWTDISSWYWAALLGKTHGPWWSIVEIAPSSVSSSTTQ